MTMFKPPPSDRAERLKIYRSRSDEERLVLQALAFIYTPCSEIELFEVLQKTRELSPRELTLERLRQLLDGLLESELSVEDETMIGCPFELSNPITMEMARDEPQRFKRFLDAVLGTMSSDNYGYFAGKSFSGLLRELRLAVLARDVRRFENIRNHLWLRFRQECREYSPVHLLFCAPFDTEWLLWQDAEVFSLVVRILLQRAENRLEDTAPLLPVVEAHLEENADSANPLYATIEHLILRGQLERAESLLAKREDIVALTCHGWLHLLRGDVEEARRIYAESYKKLNSHLRTRKSYFDHRAGFFYPMVWLGTSKPAKLRRLKSYLKTTYESSRNHSAEYAYLLDAFRVLTGQELGKLGIKLEFDLREKAIGWPFEWLIFGLNRAWTQRPLEPKQQEMLEFYRATAEEHGYLWLASEYEAILAALPGVQQSGAQPKRLAKELGTTSLVQLIATKQPWERTLELLEGVGATVEPRASRKRSADPRLVWRIKTTDGFFGDTLVITPYEQKPRGKLGWTKGRKIGLKRLAEESDQFPYLTPQDRKVASTISRRMERESWGGYRKTIYSLGSKRALLALAGHPHVYSEELPDERIEVVRTQPELYVERAGDSLKVYLKPNPLVMSDEEGWLELEGRIEVFDADRQHMKIAELLGHDGLEVPVAASERVASIIGALASMITVRSDVQAGERAAEVVTAEATPRIRIVPHGQGLRMELKVRPLGAGTVSSFPGEGSQVVVSDVDGQQKQASRDLERERENAEAVLKACPTLEATELGAYEWVLDDLRTCLEALCELDELGSKVILEWPEGEPISIRGRSRVSSLRLKIKTEQDWFGVSGQLEVDEETVLSLRELLELLAKSRERFVEIAPGQFLALTASFKRRLDELEALSEKKGKGVKVHPLATGMLEELASEVGEAQTDKGWKAHLQRIDEIREFEPEISSTFKVELRPYQIEGFQWLARLARWGVGACLADDMGLGKTVQALALLLDRAPDGPALVVAPTSVCGNWVEETARFAPTLSVSELRDSDRRELVEGAGAFDVVLCSYGLLQSEAELLSSRDWGTAVLDEAQAIKNEKTKTSRAAMRLQASARLVMTGTPIQNQLGELWTLFRFLNPGLLGSRRRFNERFALPIERDRDREARRRLKRLVQPFILRRTKSQVLTDLPPRTEIRRLVELPAEEAALYEALRRQSLERLEEGDGDSGQGGARQIEILAELTKLRRACCHPRLAHPEVGLAGAKLEAMTEIVTELISGGHKALIFSQFVDYLSIIRERLDELGVAYQYLDGSTPARERQERVSAFQSGEGDLFLISLRAGGFGLNLTAADYVIHMDPWWNPAVEDQGSDRTHRIGQSRPVTVYKLVAKGTIEEKIIELHHQKRDLAEKLLDGTDAVGRASAEELLELIR